MVGYVSSVEGSSYFLEGFWEKMDDGKTKHMGKAMMAKPNTWAKRRFEVGKLPKKIIELSKNKAGNIYVSRQR